MKKQDKPMKLVVGMGTLEDYLPLVEAGADEVFCGYVPVRWSQQFGDRTPMNRREVLYTNVLLGSESELEILADMQAEKKVPVVLALNALHYTEEQREFLLSYMKHCQKLGFSRFIVAEEKLLRRKGTEEKELPHNSADCDTVFPQNDAIKLHLSGEYGELNRLVLKTLETATDSLCRIIFPRQTTISEMASMIRQSPWNEYEAFLFNERCHYTGAYCNSLHTDYCCHICKLPYRLEAVPLEADNPEPDMTGTDRPETDVTETDMTKADLPGNSGCGLCALWKLRAAGITHLKLVSRGNFVEETIKDVKLLKQALRILENAPSEAAYIETMKQTIFTRGCSGNCYYRE